MKAKICDGALLKIDREDESFNNKYMFRILKQQSFRIKFQDFKQDLKQEINFILNL